VSRANRRHSREPVGPDDVLRVIAQMKSEGYGNDAGLEVTTVTELEEMES